MKLAFSKGSGLTLEAAARVASRTEFSSVELSGAELQQMGVAKVGQIFGEMSLEVAAVNFGNDVLELVRHLELTAAAGSRNMRIRIDSLLDRSGILKTSAIEKLGHAGDVAADFGIMMLIDNQFSGGGSLGGKSGGSLGGSSGAAVRLWHIVDRLNHPAIACAWNAASAVLAGDNPTVAIPTLNSRIRYVELDVSNPAIQAEKTLNRLRGIGFEGHLLVNTAGNVQSESDLEASLASAQAKLRQWKILPGGIGVGA